MADLVVGLSKTAVQLLADKVKSAIKEEAEQWKTVQRDLVFITGEFEMMQAFLDTASEEHVRNRIVRTWVRQVRELSHDVEDNIDFVLHLDPTKPRSSWWLRLVPSCGWAGLEVTPPPVDEAVAETTLLRARVVDVSQRNIRYNLIADSASKPMPAMDPVQKAAASSFDVLINAVKKSGLLDLAELITREDRDLHVVSICGTEGDLVNVAIVRKMYCDSRIHRHFQCRAWVKLMHPFNPHEFLRSLMTQFFTHSCQEQEDVIVGLNALVKMQATKGDLDLINEFAQKINTHRYLIVLEDLCTIVQWDAIRSYLPDREKGSRIVVLTHHPVVASQCTGEPCRVSELEQFSLGHSVRVFYKESFQHDRVQSFAKAKSYDSLLNYGLFGRDTEMKELYEKIKESRLISVWGMPGVGKSALIKAIYQELRTSKEFNRHAWVSVSHPFSPRDFCRSLLVNLHTESTSLEGGNANALGAEDPIKECHNYLRECVCLLVIDDVLSNEDWDWIKSNLIQHGDSKSCIITITSEENLAKHCAVSSIGVYNVKGLDATAAKRLFKKVIEAYEEREKVLAGKSDEDPRYEQAVAEFKRLRWDEDEESKEEAIDILLSKCSGLPRVITTVAVYLARTEWMRCRKLGYQSYFINGTMRLSDNFIQEVATNPEFDSLRDIQAWMHFYLDACPRHLKKCMLYLSIFPPDTIIRRSRLIRRWIAEGYSKGTDSNSMVKHAEKIFEEVAAQGMMQPVLQAGKVIGYQVNYFFREYIMSRPLEKRLFFPVDVSALEKQGHGRLSTEGIGQHLAIGRTWEIDRVALDSMDLSRLRSLTVFNIWFRSFYICERMKVLRVLDLENAVIDSDSDFLVIGKLPSRLKFLSLRGQRVISQLPEFVRHLVQLQTLDIRDTSIVTLPLFITELRKLQYIRAGTTVAWTDDDISSSDGAEEGSTPSDSRSRTRTLLASCLPKKFLRRGPVVGSRSGGVVLPGGIKRLEALQTLGAVHVNTADEEAILGEILSLPQLKKLQVSGISEKHRERYIWTRLKHSTHLESLTIHSRNHFVFHNLPESLRSLKMCGHVKDLEWNLSRFNNLVKLTIQTSAQFSAIDSMCLRNISSLRTLRLRVNKVEDGELLFPEFRLSKLQVLEIACKSKLHVSFELGAMEKLEQLKIHWLQGSEMQFSGLENPVSLKEIWLLGSFDDALKEEVWHQCGKHPKKPALMVKVEPPPSDGSISTVVGLEIPPSQGLMSTVVDLGRYEVYCSRC